MSARLVVIGLGNEYRRDDGLGPAVVRALRGRLPGGAEVAAVADTVDLLTAWDRARLAVVVDLVLRTPPDPGRLHRLTVDGPDTVGTPGGHGTDVAAALALARILGTAPGRVVLYTVEGVDVRAGVGLSPAVRRAVPAAAAAVASELVSGSVRRHAPSRRGGPRGR
ncbi:hydrogenase maturation protease [Prescottella agglutinans]|uniref:hydrogenase maturation protease n=1 Tax=Prescottella agglutinans TaxID=1644129 RepID=UPI003D97D56A